MTQFRLFLDYIEKGLDGLLDFLIGAVCVLDEAVKLFDHYMILLESVSQILLLRVQSQQVLLDLSKHGLFALDLLIQNRL